MMRGTRSKGKIRSVPVVAVDGEGDALVEEGEVGGLLAAAKFFGVEADERSLYRSIVRTRDIVRAEHLVVGFSVLLVGEWR